jgi:phage/plasmid-like protein (TIGR03299 family)
MSHEIFINVRGKASLAYVNDEPWHGLGQELTADASLETWIEEAGFNYTIDAAPAQYTTPAGIQVMDSRNVLYRSDTNAPLSVVGSKYKVVQPGEVMEFFRDLTESQAFELETAGSLFNGQKYWALARTGKTARIGGKGSKDVVNGYLMLATSCDGTLQTVAQFTSVRVVCNNTLTAALGTDRKNLNAVKVSHRSIFDAAKVKEALCIDTSWSDFVDGANELAQIKVSDKDALDFVIHLVGDPAKPAQDQAEATKAVATVYQLYKGKGRGSELKSSEDTAWGLVNAVTEYVDHFAGASADNRFYLGQFYDNAYLKNQAFQDARGRFAKVPLAA